MGRAAREEARRIVIRCGKGTDAATIMEWEQDLSDAFTSNNTADVERVKHYSPRCHLSAISSAPTLASTPIPKNKLPIKVLGCKHQPISAHQIKNNEQSHISPEQIFPEDPSSGPRKTPHDQQITRRDLDDHHTVSLFWISCRSLQ
ncbi:unnamed protein product [Allacma fusca]|uniref:Uncharacterized protein n=1 Tax=Allacma fusca TaxID=39272 RepID=A0A8J2JNX6_9HEXA|nr:unnamed protein product [Allacma fusca]